MVFSSINLNDGYFWASTAEKIIVHEKFNTQELYNDIGLVKTKESAPTTGEICQNFNLI